jgi:GNAT superfamily N-acetyltransferase
LDTISVREASPHDAAHIIEFQKKMARETEQLELDDDVLAPGVHAVFADPSKGRYYVAQKNGRVIGSLLTTYEWSDWRNGTIVWLQSVYVQKEDRGAGVFGKMYRFIRSLVEEHHDYKGIRLYVDKSNTVARSVYRALGMTDHHYDTFEWMKPGN